MDVQGARRPGISFLLAFGVTTLLLNSGLFINLFDLITITFLGGYYCYYMGCEASDGLIDETVTLWNAEYPATHTHFLVQVVGITTAFLGLLMVPRALCFSLTYHYNLVFLVAIIAAPVDYGLHLLLHSSFMSPWILYPVLVMRFMHNFITLSMNQADSQDFVYWTTGTMLPNEEATILRRAMQWMVDTYEAAVFETIENIVSFITSIVPRSIGRRLLADSRGVWHSPASIRKLDVTQMSMFQLEDYGNVLLETHRKVRAELNKRMRSHKRMKRPNAPEDTDTCVICLVSPAQITTRPCMHRAVCTECWEDANRIVIRDDERDILQCPLCRVPVLLWTDKKRSSITVLKDAPGEAQYTLQNCVARKDSNAQSPIDSPRSEESPTETAGPSTSS
eukprot:Clim_evm4s70 gene=Clim_evmTU4s70